VNATILLRATLTDDVGVETVFSVPPGGATGQDYLTLSTTTKLAALASALSTTFDTATKGLVIVELKGATTTDYAISIGANSGGSFGIDAGGMPAASTATLSTTSPEIVYYDVDPGMTTVTVTPPAGRTCTPDYAVPSYEVDPGIGTQVSFSCD